jgi:hypothetical protein
MAAGAMCTEPWISMATSSMCSCRSVETARRRGDSSAALTTLKVTPTEVVSDAAPVYPRDLDELIPAAWHH